MISYVPTVLASTLILFLGIEYEVQEIESEKEAVRTFRGLPETQRLVQDLFLSPGRTVSQEDPGPLHGLMTRLRVKAAKSRHKNRRSFLVELIAKFGKATTNATARDT